MRTIWISSLLAFSLLTRGAAAQTAGTQEGGLTSPTTNLTITFSPGTLDDCAVPSTEDNAGGITFTTASTPLQNYCFNLEDLFLGPTTTNITQNISRVSTLSSGGLRSFRDGSYNLTYALSNPESYDPALNYSRIYYSQPASGAPPGYGTAGLPTNTSARLVNLFWDRDCVSRRNESAPEDQQEVPRYRYRCPLVGKLIILRVRVRPRFLRLFQFCQDIVELAKLSHPLQILHPSELLTNCCAIRIGAVIAEGIGESRRTTKADLRSVEKTGQVLNLERQVEKAFGVSDSPEVFAVVNAFSASATASAAQDLIMRVAELVENGPNHSQQTRRSREIHCDAYSVTGGYHFSQSATQSFELERAVGCQATAKEDHIQTLHHLLHE
ncbi:hypothetical protein TI39_contig482g00009 [Zymoseptoria brevis]|uniref:Uncharacterized protein n=1 Tax=Zymoseptoria brevis TaxID=1047168 RepID=A0A0F4GJH5_9PEZI|nr:hypothetical protein TI39_contig482g00009 [Zymoseptoria brevis]